MDKTCFIIVGLAAFGLLAQCAVGIELKVPEIFSDHMVLQCEQSNPVWGWASPGERVTVRFAGRETSAIAGEDGQWKVWLEAQPASAEPRELIITAGKFRKKFTNVVVGEIWLCSGQSNMACSFTELKIAHKVKNVDCPLIRLSKGHGWNVCNFESLKEFSCVGYYFGRELRRELNIPIGLLNISRGCSSIEAWMTPESLGDNVFLQDKFREMKRFQDFFTNYKQLGIAEKERIFQAHCLGEYTFARTYLRDGKPDPTAYDNILWHMTVVKPGFLYNSLIAPLVPFGIKGVIWYQGETNHRDCNYAAKQQILIETWRKLWGKGEFPFYIVQVAPCNEYPNLPEFWLEQYKAVSRTKNTGIISTVDVGELHECHPPNKLDVGRRLAFLALRDTYCRKKVVASGPTFKTAERIGNRLIVSFDNQGSGLVTRDGKEPDWFEVAAEDKEFFKAEASIFGDTVEVFCSQVKIPVYVRYGWSNLAQPNLINREGLPAFPFNSAFPFFTEKRKYVKTSDQQDTSSLLLLEQQILQGAKL